MLGAVFLLLMAGAPVPFAGTAELPGLVDAIRRLAPPKPKFFLIGGDLVYGHPLNRQVQGTWVGRMACLWTTDNATLLLRTPDLDPVRRKAVLAARQRDREILVEDIAHSRPDVIVVEDDRWNRWISEHVDVTAVLRAYREVERAEGARVLLRRDASRS